MNSQNVFDVIEGIAGEPSKNVKLAMVTSAMTDPLFKRVCSYAYNPFKTYGIKQIPERQDAGTGALFGDQTWQILDDLISRKLSGNLARDMVQEEINLLDSASADLFVRIIRKDLRAGFSESTCNKACKGLIPEFPYQRCSLPKDADLAKWPWVEGVISQEKADSMFANCDHEEGGLVSIRSRQGSEFPMDKFAAIADDIRTRFMSGYQIHGEIVVKRDGVVLAREIANGILNSVLSGGDFGPGEVPVYMIWDQIPLTSIVPKGKYAMTYKARLGKILTQIKAAPGTAVELVPTRIVKSLADAYAHAVELMKKGKEGTVIKHPNATWKDGTSKEQIKIKLEFDVDLEVVAIVPGRAGTKNEGRAGSLTCKTSDGKLQVDVTVKNEALRNQIDANPTDIIGRIIPVIANDIMRPSESNDLHSLFLPRMAEAGYRKDKTVADSLERVFAIKEAAIFGEALMKEAA